MNNIAKYFIVLILLSPACSTINAQPKSYINISSRINSLSTSINSQEGYDKIYIDNRDETTRNAIIMTRMELIDLQFNDFRHRIFIDKSISSSLKDIAVAGLGTAGALTTAGATRVLSVITAGMGQAFTSYEKEFLYTHTITNLITIMQTNREAISGEIHIKMKKKINEYSLGMALDDVEKYYFAGTIIGAIISLSNMTASNATDINNKVKVAEGFEKPKVILLMEAVNKSTDDNMLTQAVNSILTTLDTGTIAKIKNNVSSFNPNDTSTAYSIADKRIILNTYLLSIKDKNEELVLWESKIQKLNN